MTQAFINNLADKLQKVGALHAVGETWISIDSTIPAGGVPFLGQLVNRSVWADLFAWATAQGKVKTESEWQSYASANGGNCPFYSDGDGSTTFRMPKIVGYIKGAASQSEAGSYTAEGLPNIGGSLSAHNFTGILGAYGAFKTGSTTGGVPLGNTSVPDKSYKSIAFDASKANSIYGNSAHVTPETHSILIGVYAVGVVANIGSADATQFLNGLAALESEMTTYERVNSSGTGYIRYESGLQICWGRGSISGSHYMANVTLPVAFISLSYDVVVGSNESGDCSYSVAGYINDSSNFTISAKKFDGTYGLHKYYKYIAVGRWK